MREAFLATLLSPTSALSLNAFVGGVVPYRQFSVGPGQACRAAGHVVAGICARFLQPVLSRPANLAGAAQARSRSRAESPTSADLLFVWCSYP